MKTKGSVLIFVIWVLMVLTIIAAGLGRHARAGLSLVNAHVRYANAKAISWAGIMDMIDRLRREADRKPEPDTLYACGLHISDDVAAANIFRGKIEEGGFVISYRQDGRAFDGLNDEERRVNLNAVADGHRKIVAELARLAGLNEDERQRLIGAVVAARQRGFEAVQELVSPDGISKESYALLKDYVTVFPKSPVGLTINFDTADRLVLRALSRGMIDEAAMSTDDADRLVDKMLRFRSGDDGQEATADDRVIDFSALDLNAVERRLAEKLSSVRTTHSNYLRIRSQGTFQRAVVTFQAVIYRPHLSLVAWQRDDD